MCPGSGFGSGGTTALGRRPGRALVVGWDRSAQSASKQFDLVSQPCRNTSCPAAFSSTRRLQAGVDAAQMRERVLIEIAAGISDALHQPDHRRLIGAQLVTDGGKLRGDRRHGLAHDTALIFAPRERFLEFIDAFGGLLQKRLYVHRHRCLAQVQVTGTRRKKPARGERAILRGRCRNGSEPARPADRGNQAPVNQPDRTKKN